eukprot:2440444-Alexandrium_andersonii.AAC.1
MFRGQHQPHGARHPHVQGRPGLHPGELEPRGQPHPRRLFHTAHGPRHIHSHGIHIHGIHIQVRGDAAR